MYVTDASRWEEFGRAHAEFFAKSPPATALVEVRALVDPQMLVEVEVDAIVQRPARRPARRKARRR